jgi:tryptophan synthase alpha subunit
VRPLVDKKDKKKKVKKTSDGVLLGSEVLKEEIKKTKKEKKKKPNQTATGK